MKTGPKSLGDCIIYKTKKWPIWWSNLVRKQRLYQSIIYQILTQNRLLTWLPVLALWSRMPSTPTQKLLRKWQYRYHSSLRLSSKVYKQWTCFTFDSRSLNCFKWVIFHRLVSNRCQWRVSKDFPKFSCKRRPHWTFNKFLKRHEVIVEKCETTLRNLRLAFSGWVVPWYPLSI